MPSSTMEYFIHSDDRGLPRMDTILLDTVRGKLSV